MNIIHYVRYYWQMAFRDITRASILTVLPALHHGHCAMYEVATPQPSGLTGFRHRGSLRQRRPCGLPGVDLVTGKLPNLPAARPPFLAHYHLNVMAAKYSGRTRQGVAAGCQPNAPDDDKNGASIASLEYP